MADTDQGSASASTPPWLFTPTVRAAPPDGSGLGEMLMAYRSAHRLSQSDLAELLHLDQTFVSRLETKKRVVRDVEELRRIAAVLDLPEAELGLLPLANVSVDVSPSVAARGNDPRNVLASQRRWRSTRRVLNAHRGELTGAAARLYPDLDRIGGTPLLTCKDWMPPEPVDLDRINLLWRAASEPPALSGAEPESDGARPLSVRGGRHAKYSEALRLVDRPGLFVNRPSFRLLDVGWGSDGDCMEFGYTTYFDMVDVCEAAAHELAQVWDSHGQSRPWLDRPDWAGLDFRALIGDPFDLARRPVLPSIDTLTLRRDTDGTAAFILHRREAANVALAGGVLHVMPAGVFQPSTVLPWDQSRDFDLWLNMAREYAEEFLGDPEADGESGEAIDYEEREPYRSLGRARWEGSLRTWCFGVGLDPLTLAGEILAVAVFDADVYDEVFRDMVVRNTEGAVVGADPHRPEAGIPFTEPNVKQLLDTENLAPAAAACLHLAWHHRDLLL